MSQTERFFWRLAIAIALFISASITYPTMLAIVERRNL